MEAKQKSTELCIKCRKLDFQSTAAYPGSFCVVRIHEEPKCVWCRFLRCSLVRSGSIPITKDAQRSEYDIGFHTIRERYGEESLSGGLSVSCFKAGVHQMDGPVLFRLGTEDDIERRPSSFGLTDPCSVNFDFLQVCINQCWQHHQRLCSRAITGGDLASKEVIGFKVIDCFRREVTAQKLSGSTYVALSYVWGEHRLRASSANAKFEAQRGTLPKYLPATIEDAITATKRLGFRYLWVDKYCIDQSNATEVHCQIKLMDLIYDTAAVTIIAAAGTDSEYGLPGLGRPRTAQNIVTVECNVWRSARNYCAGAVGESHWMTRGWTYQEQFFSRRCVIFTDEQVIFNCRTGSCCEEEHESNYRVPKRYDPHIADDDKLEDRIANYASRMLTYESDILNGIKGVFRYIATRNRPEYQYWGVPISTKSYWAFHALDLIQDENDNEEMPSSEAIISTMSLGLSWSRDFLLNEREIPRSVKRRHGFPSWSWCGWTVCPNWPGIGGPHLDCLPEQIQVQKIDGSRLDLSQELAKRLFLDDSLSSRFTYNLCVRAEVLDITIAYFTESLRFRENHLSVTRYAAKAVRNARPENGDSVEIEKGILLWPMEPTPNMDESHELHTTLLNQVLQCVNLANSWGLVVQEKGKGIFERVGLIHVLAVESEELWFNKGGPHLREYFPSSIRDIVIG